MPGILHIVPRRGEQTFTELAARVTPPDLTGETEDELISRATKLVADRLTIAVQAGMVFAELLDREHTAVDLERATTLHRRTVARWAEPFRRTS